MCERILHNMPLNNLEQTISVASIVHDTSLWNFLRSYKNTGHISFSVGELPLQFLYHNDQLPWNQDKLEARGFVLMYWYLSMLYTFLLDYFPEYKLKIFHTNIDNKTAWDFKLRRIRPIMFNINYDASLALKVLLVQWFY